MCLCMVMYFLLVIVSKVCNTAVQIAYIMKNQTHSSPPPPPAAGAGERPPYPPPNEHMYQDE